MSSALAIFFCNLVGTSLGEIECEIGLEEDQHLKALDKDDAEAFLLSFLKGEIEVSKMRDDLFRLLLEKSEINADGIEYKLSANSQYSFARKLEPFLKKLVPNLPPLTVKSTTKR